MRPRGPGNEDGTSAASTCLASFPVPFSESIGRGGLLAGAVSSAK